MASTPTPTTPADYDTTPLPFPQQGTNATAGAFVELRGENGLLVPASANPAVATGPGFTIPGVTSLVGNRGATYAYGSGMVQVSDTIAFGASTYNASVEDFLTQHSVTTSYAAGDLLVVTSVINEPNTPNISAMEWTSGATGAGGFRHHLRVSRANTYALASGSGSIEFWSIVANSTGSGTIRATYGAQTYATLCVTRITGAPSGVVYPASFEGANVLSQRAWSTAQGWVTGSNANLYAGYRCTYGGHLWEARASTSALGVDPPVAGALWYDLGLISMNALSCPLDQTVYGTYTRNSRPAAGSTLMVAGVAPRGATTRSVNAAAGWTEIVDRNLHPNWTVLTFIARLGVDGGASTQIAAAADMNPTFTMNIDPVTANANDGWNAAVLEIRPG